MGRGGEFEREPRGLHLAASDRAAAAGRPATRAEAARDRQERLPLPGESHSDSDSL